MTSPGSATRWARAWSSQANATWAGVQPRRSAVARTAGWLSTGLSGMKAEPSGKNGTKGTPSIAQASKTSCPERSATL